MNCPVCGGLMHPVRNLDVCLRCGWRGNSCCEGQAACPTPPEAEKRAGQGKTKDKEGQKP